MNPLTNVKNITKLNEIELASGSIHKKSWHDMYKDSAWIFIGGLEYGLTEGDVLAVFSQYGEIMNINLVRDKKSGKSKGFCFLCYANQKSTVLAVDNFNGIKLCGRTIRVDHVSNYKPPKEYENDDEITKMLKSEGCAPNVLQNNESTVVKIKKKKSKKEKKEKKKKKRKNKSDASDSDKGVSTVEVKKEKHDPGYDKYDTSSSRTHDVIKGRHSERNFGSSKGESSHSHENYISKGDRHHYKTEKDIFIDRHNSKIKIEQESYEERFIHMSSSTKHKRKRSMSLSDDSAKNYNEKKRHNDKKDEPKRYLNHKRKHKAAKDSTSSSSDDDDDSSSLSSEDTNHKDRNRYSRKDKVHFEKKSYLEKNTERNYDRRENSTYISSKGKYGKREKYSEHKSKIIYGSDDSDDSYHKNSHYHKNKHTKK